MPPIEGNQPAQDLNRTCNASDDLDVGPESESLRGRTSRRFSLVSPSLSPVGANHATGAGRQRWHSADNADRPCGAEDVDIRHADGAAVIRSRELCLLDDGTTLKKLDGTRRTNRLVDTFIPDENHPFHLPALKGIHLFDGRAIYSRGLQGGAGPETNAKIKKKIAEIFGEGLAAGGFPTVVINTDSIGIPGANANAYHHCIDSLELDFPSFDKVQNVIVKGLNLEKFPVRMLSLPALADLKLPLSSQYRRSDIDLSVWEAHGAHSKIDSITLTGSFVHYPPVLQLRTLKTLRLESYCGPYEYKNLLLRQVERDLEAGQGSQLESLSLTSGFVPEFYPNYPFVSGEDRIKLPDEVFGLKSLHTLELVGYCWSLKSIKSQSAVKSLRLSLMDRPLPSGFFRFMPKLEKLDTEHFLITQEAANELREYCHDLREIRLHKDDLRRTGISESQLSTLLQLPGLSSLHISANQYRQQIKDLITYGGNLETLGFQNGFSGSNTTHGQIFLLPRLRRLEIDGFADTVKEALSASAKKTSNNPFSWKSTSAANSSSSVEHLKWVCKGGWDHLPKVLEYLPNLKVLDLSHSYGLDLRPLASAIAADRSLCQKLERLILDDCPRLGMKGPVPPEILGLSHLSVEPPELAFEALGLPERDSTPKSILKTPGQVESTAVAVSRSVQFDPMALALSTRTSPTISEDGTDTASVTRTHSSLSTVGSALDVKSKKIWAIQRKIIKQLDQIYDQQPGAYYYEMNKLAFITLLEGAQILRTGIRPFELKVSTSIVQSLSSAPLDAVGPAVRAAQALGRITSNLSGVAAAAAGAPGAAGTVLDFVFDKWATREFTKANEKIAKVLDISGRNIGFFADTMARALTLMHLDEVNAPATDMQSPPLQALKSTAREWFNRALEFVSGRSSAEEKSETLIRLLATQHACEIIFAMAEGDEALVDSLLEALKPAKKRPYETDHLKIVPALQWHSDKHFPEGTEHDYEQIVVWGEREAVLTKDELDEGIQAKLERDARRKLNDTALQQGFAGLEESVKTAQQGFANRLEQAETRLDDKQAELEKTLLNTTEELAETKGKVVELEDENKKLNADVEKLQGEVKGLTDSNQRLTHSNQRLTHSNQRLEGEVKGLKGLVTGMANQLQELLKNMDTGQRTDRDEPPALEGEVFALREAVTRNTAGLAQLKQGVSVVTASVVGLTDLAHQVRIPMPATGATPGSSVHSDDDADAGRFTELDDDIGAPRTQSPDQQSTQSATNSERLAAQPFDYERARLEMDQFDLEEMTNLITAIVSHLNVQTMQARAHDEDEGTLNAPDPFQNVLIDDKGEPKIQRQATLRMPGVWDKTKTDSISEYLERKHGRWNSKPYTYQGDLYPCLKHLEISRFHPDLVEIGKLYRPKVVSGNANDDSPVPPSAASDVQGAHPQSAPNTAEPSTAAFSTDRTDSTGVTRNKGKATASSSLPLTGNTGMEVGVLESSLGIGTGPMIWSTLAERLEMHLSTLANADQQGATPAEGSTSRAMLKNALKMFNPLRSQTPASTPTSLETAAADLQRFGKLLRTTLEENVLLDEPDERHMTEAVTALRQMSGKVEEFSDTLGTQAASAVAGLQQTLQELEEALRPITSAAQSLHSARESAGEGSRADSPIVRTPSPKSVVEGEASGSIERDELNEGGA